MKNKKLIPLDKFITQALYNKKKGYYMRKNPFGQTGDFITSPNISILFSEMISIWLICLWENLKKPKQINIIELGAGNGEMMLQITRTLKNFNQFFNACNFYIYEKSPFLEKIQKKKLKILKVTWIKNFNQLKNNTNIYLSNEFFDSFPIKQFLKKKGAWYEKYISLKNKKIELKKTNIYKYEKKYKINFSKNQNFVEFSPSLFKILFKISKNIKKNSGGILVIDYFNDRKKMFNTLQSIKSHKKNNFLSNIGNSDITHLPNLHLIKKMFKLFKLKINGVTSQGDFLKRLGILTRAEIISKNLNFTKKAEIYYRVKRLIGSKQMGSLFKVAFISNSKIKFNFGLK